MADAITHEERAAIAEAISAGLVTKVPAGEVSIQTEITWCERLRRLVYVDKNAAKARAGSWGNAGRKKPHHRKGVVDPDVAERREKVRELIGLNMTAKEISDRLKETEWNVRKDAKVLGLNFRNMINEASQERNDKVRKYMDSGMTQQEIGDILGMSQSMVARAIKAIRKAA